jgi:hypothetical protein
MYRTLCAGQRFKPMREQPALQPRAEKQDRHRRLGVLNGRMPDRAVQAASAPAMLEEIARYEAARQKLLAKVKRRLEAIVVERFANVGDVDCSYVRRYISRHRQPIDS